MKNSMMEHMRKMPMFPLMPVVPMMVMITVVSLSILNYRCVKRIEEKLNRVYPPSSCCE